MALRAPLAERSAVNRQVLGSIPSGGVPPLIYAPPFILFSWGTGHAMRISKPNKVTKENNKYITQGMSIDWSEI